MDFLLIKPATTARYDARSGAAPPPQEREQAERVMEQADPDSPRSRILNAALAQARDVEAMTIAIHREHRKWQAAIMPKAASPGAEIYRTFFLRAERNYSTINV